MFQVSGFRFDVSSFRFNASLSTLLFLASVFSVSAQYQITGTVSSETGEPIPGAVIKIHELHRGTTCDLNGNFKIDNIKSGNYHLHFTAFGYHAYTLDTLLNSANLVLAIELEESVN